MTEKPNHHDQPVWPNLFLVGTVKGGTTSLYRHLKKHPRVYFPDFKEPHFFSHIHPRSDRKHLLEFVTEEEEYLGLYKNNEGYSVIGDASTSYLWSEVAASAIYEKKPGAKIIILLRDPVVRAHSHYLMDYREGVNDEEFTVEMLQRDFEDADMGFARNFLYVEMGLYYLQVKRYLEKFGSDNVLLLQFDDLVQQPDHVMEEVARFLGIEKEPFTQLDLSTAHNAFKAPRGNWARKCAAHPWSRWVGYHLMSKNLQWWFYQNLILKKDVKPPIDQKVRAYLESIYDDDIKLLESFLERKLPSLRASW